MFIEKCPDFLGTKCEDYVSCGGVILCFEVMVVTREDFLLKFAALGQARKLA